MAKALGKLEQAVRIANERDLLLVILGDLFHLATESSNALQVRLLRILRQAKYRPKCSGGNHDKEGTLLADTDALTLIAEAGGLEVFDGGKRSWPASIENVRGTGEPVDDAARRGNSQHDRGGRG